MQVNSGVRSYLIISVGIVILLIFGWFIISYNTLIEKEEQVKTAWSQVESTLQRKIDLLPNLVKVVKRYATHEKELLGNITKLRSRAFNALQNRAKLDNISIEQMEDIQSKLNSSMVKLYAVAENYPQLRSSEQFLQLQSQIEGAENRINITRLQFNDAVGEFNRYMRVIPANIVASVAGFKRKAYFQAKKEVHKSYKVEM